MDAIYPEEALLNALMANPNALEDQAIVRAALPVAEKLVQRKMVDLAKLKDEQAKLEMLSCKLPEALRLVELLKKSQNALAEAQRHAQQEQRDKDFYNAELWKVSSRSYADVPRESSRQDYEEALRLSWIVKRVEISGLQSSLTPYEKTQEAIKQGKNEEFFNLLMDHKFSPAQMEHLLGMACDRNDTNMIEILMGHMEDSSESAPRQDSSNNSNY